MKSTARMLSAVFLVSVALVSSVHAQGLVLTSPKKGVNWNPGNYHAITWSGIASPDTYVRLEFSTDGGDTWKLISDSAFQSAYIWRIPEVNSRRCKVRASTVNDTTIVLVGHEAFVNTGSYSNDGKLVVTASDDGTAIVWSARTGERLQTYIGHTDDIMYACFSPDDKQLLTSSFDGTAAIWDVASGRRLFVMRSKTSSAAMNYASYSPDGVLVATSGWDNTVRIWNAYNGEPIKALNGHADVVCSSFFHPRGDKIISTSRDGSVIVWDIQTAKAVKTFTLPASSDWAVWNPAGDRIVAACRDGNAYVIDAQSYDVKGTISYHRSWVWSAEYSKDGRQIITGGRDGAVAVWDAQSFKRIRSFDICSTDVGAARFSPDGTEFLTASNDNLARITRFAGSDNRLTALSDSLFSIMPKVSGLDEVPGDQPLSLIPNPANEFVTIHAQSCTDNAQVVVIDAFGAEVVRCALRELPHERLSTAGLPNGMYTVCVQDGPLSTISRVAVAR